MAQSADTLPELPASASQLRPVRVTVLEFGSPAAEADVCIEHFSPTSSWWHARTRADGRATLLVPIEYTWFRVSASKAPNAIAAQFVRHLPPRAEPLDVALNMTNQGVVITALLEAARPAMLSNVTVRIRPSDDPDWEDVSIARVPHTSGPRVALPPVRRGLRGLRVEVTGPHIPASYSAYFDTLDGRDKTISVRVLEGVRVYGTARMADGRAAGSFILTGTPAGMHGLAAGAGVVHETLTTDAEGAYECTQFAADFYRVQAQCGDMHTFRTNVLVGDEGTRLDVVFAPQATLLVRGRVLVERTQQAVPGAIVHFEGRRTVIATTDVAGAFAMQVPRESEFYGTVRVSHENYAGVCCYLHDRYDGEEVVFLLRAAAVITGTVKYEDGTPASNVCVTARMCEDEQNESRQAQVKFGDFAYDRPFMPRHEYTSSERSDGSGTYVISNVAAPAEYTFSVWGATSRVLKPQEGAPGACVEPGGTARCDLIVKRVPQVFVQLRTAQGTVVREYELVVECYAAEGGDVSSGSEWMVARPNADGWYKVENWALCNTIVFLNLRAIAPDGAVAETNHVRFTDGRTYYITLVAVSNTSCGIRGYLYNEDNEPLVDVSISADYGLRSSKSVRTDHLGYFELPGSGAPTSSMVQLRAWLHERSYTTNILESAEPVIWTLETSRTVSGRVCIEHPGQPATNFAVGFDLYNRRPFMEPNGRFALYVKENQPTAGMVYAWVTGYAPATTPYALLPRGNTDIGDVIITPSACTVRGRVVNERGAPVCISVSLNLCHSEYPTLHALTSPEDGRYEFSLLPTGMYQVTAYNNALPGQLESEWFMLAPAQCYTVPDLVAYFTNAALVRIVFVKADGIPAAYMHVAELSRRTDASGAVEDYVRLGQHNNWTLSDGHYTYYAEPFEIRPGAREVRVSLAPAEMLQGTVTINGAPLVEGYMMLQAALTRRMYDAQVINGLFACKAQPGVYYAALHNQALIAKVTLAAGADNHIAFVSGTAAVAISLPVAGDWSASLLRAMDGLLFHAGDCHADNSAALAFEHLQPGTYRLEVFGELRDGTTNLQREVQLSPGQRTTVAF